MSNKAVDRYGLFLGTRMKLARLGSGWGVHLIHHFEFTQDPE